MGRRVCPSEKMAPAQAPPVQGAERLPEGALQVLRVQGPTWITAVCAVGLGGVFIFATYKWWWAVLASGIVFFAAWFAILSRNPSLNASSRAW